jgi:hypothetical protein
MFYEPGAEQREVFRTLKFGNLTWKAEHFPMPAERVASSLNFPAKTLNYPFDRFRRDVYFGWVANRRVWFDFHDCTYLVCTAMFWLWIGTILDRRSRKGIKRHWFLIAESSIGIILGLLCGSHAFNVFFKYPYTPMRQISFGGFVWAIMLIVFFSKPFIKQQDSKA